MLGTALTPTLVFKIVAGFNAPRRDTLVVLHHVVR